MATTVVLLCLPAAGVAASSAAALLGAAVVGAVWRGRARKEIEVYERDAVDARARLQRGQLVEAVGVFWQWAEQARTAAVAARARIDLGMALVQQGDHARAITILEAADKNYRDEIASQKWTPRTAVWIAIAQALHGETAAARSWLAADKRGAADDELAIFVEAMVRCRTGECAAAATLLDERWIELEAGLTGRQLRAVRIVRAFAHAAAGPRATGTSAAILLGIRRSYPGEFAFLGAKWPEMAAFLATHELAG